jgi:hypothetical protein
MFQKLSPFIKEVCFVAFEIVLTYIFPFWLFLIGIKLAASIGVGLWGFLVFALAFFIAADAREWFKKFLKTHEEGQ